jgi:hypothetical protein
MNELVTLFAAMPDTRDHYLTQNQPVEITMMFD